MTSANRLSEPTIPSIALLPFLVLTFVITWGIVGFFIFFPDRATAMLGQITGRSPAFLVATWGPAISALTIVSLYSGGAGVKALLSRMLLWRCSGLWAAFVLLGIPLVFMVGSLLKGGPLIAPLPPEGASPMVVAMGVMLFLGPVEEIGWRGVAQPLLQRHMAPLWAGLIIGSVWGLWHLPAFFLAGAVQSGWAFTPFFIGNVVLAVIVTPLFNSARGSLLWPMIFHWQLINPFWPDAQPYDTWILTIIAVVVVWLNRATMFTRAGAVTEVIPDTAMRPI